MEGTILEQLPHPILPKELLNLGFKEHIVIEKNRLSRYAKPPDNLRKYPLNLPSSIKRLPSILLNQEEYLKLPTDSIPLNLLDLEQHLDIDTQYYGIASNLSPSILFLSQNNPDLTNILQEQGAEFADLLIISMEESQTYILL